MANELDEALNLLDSPLWQERVEAVRRLSALDDPRAMEGLIRALHDSRNTAVVQAAAESLLERFDSASMGALADAWESEDFDVTQTVGGVLSFAAARGRFADELVNRPTEWAEWWQLTGAGQLRTLLMGVWDPLGVSDVPGAYDEYDSYAGQIFNKLLEGAGEEEIFTFMKSVVYGAMGLSVSSEGSRAAAHEVVIWFDRVRFHLERDRD